MATLYTATPSRLKQPVKKITFSEAALTVFRNAQWGESGLTLKITQQLDRSLYTEVNRALEVLGGYWDKKAKMHLFQVDPREALGIFIETGSMTIVKDGYFQTPEPVIRTMFSYTDFTNSHLVLEPEAGGMAIARQILQMMPGRKQSIHVCELNPERAAELRAAGFTFVGSDFMEYDPGQIYDLILMNPPFERGQDIDHASHAYTLLAAGGRLISVMSEGAFYRNDNKAKDFRLFLHDVKARVVPLPQDSFASSGTGVNTRIVIADAPGAAM